MTVTVQRWKGTPPDADPTRRAVVLPGRAYPVELPGLWTPMRALALAGWDVWHATWGPADVPPERARAVVESAVERMGDGARLVVGKSLGSMAAGWAADEGVPAVWLTPLLTYLQVPDDIARSAAPTLLVAGTRDHTWDDDAAAGIACPQVRLHGLDHGLLCGDLDRELAALRVVGRSVADFASALTG